MKGPFTTPEDIAARPADYVRVSQQEIRRIVTLQSSGSTGKPKRLFFTRGDLEHTVEFFRSGMAWLCGSGDRVAVCIGSHSPDGLGRLLEEGLRRLGARPLLLGSVTRPEQWQEFARALEAFRPDTLVGLPAQVRRLALLTPQLRLRTVLLSGDYVADSVRNTVARLWQSRVFSHYGMTESGMGFAVQCPALLGHHIRQDELEVEIIDPVTLEVLPEGQWGEVVFSTLRREAMPLQRYRSGDISRLLPGVCPCGCAGPRLDRILGRRSELCKPLPVYLLDELLLGEDGILDFSARLEGTRLEVTAEFAAGDKEAQKKTEKLLKGAFPQYALVLRSGPVPPGTAKRSVLIP